MIFWLISLSLYAKPLAQCTDLPTLHTKEFKSPLSKVYNPMLYAMRNIDWEDLEQAGLHREATLEIGTDWIYWSRVSSLSFVPFIQPYLWPHAQMIDMGDHVVLDTLKGRWKAIITDDSLLITKMNAKREPIPSFWKETSSGCSIAMNSVQLPYLQAAPKEGVALSFQHKKTTVSIRLPKSGQAPKLFNKRPLGEWASLITEEIPTFALALGEEPLSLVEADILRLPEGFSLDELRSIDKKLHISPGTQVAVFGDDVVAQIPLQGWFGCPLPRWQIKWGLRSGEKISAHRRKITQDGSVWYAHAQKGIVTIASKESLLDDVLTNVGRSWFSNPDRARQENVLARLNIPSSLYMFVGPLEHVELSFSAEKSSWAFEFFPFTQSKARPQQLFLTYFATLQVWDKAKTLVVPENVRATLIKIASLTYAGAKIQPENRNAWKEGNRVFMESEDQKIWFYEPQIGIGLCDNEMTRGCESVK